MKKLLLIIIVIFCFSLVTFADDLNTAKTRFNAYVSAANTYSPTLLNYYSPKAKIIRQVVKPDGTTVNATTDMATYAKQLKLSQGTAKIRNYKNKYKNVTATTVPNGIKVSAMRQPMNDNYWLKTYQIWQKQPSGNWLIVEEMMQTKQQIFLKYADK
ncbi:hypothetical protein IJG72_07380 [bacterium]|nr:hypothetical protein [bacterium]